MPVIPVGSVIITGSAYFICLLVVGGLTYVELRKRKRLRILSWIGKSKTTDSNGTDTATRVQSQTTNQFIVGSLHYLSTIIYFGSILLCIGGLARMIANLCGQWTIVLYFFGSFSKAFILLFQLQRYYLCFVQDFVQKSTCVDSVKSKLNIFIVLNLFYIIGLISIIMGFGTFSLNVIFLVVSEKDCLHSWKGIWCTWSANDTNLRFAYIYGGWCFIYFVRLVYIVFIFCHITSIMDKTKTISTIN